MKRLLLSLVLVVASLATMAQGNGTLNQQGEMVRKGYNLYFVQGADKVLVSDGELSQILDDDTFGTLVAKFKEKGLQAKIEGGRFSVSSGFDTFSIVEDATSSNLSAIINFTQRENLGGFAMTDRSKTIISTSKLYLKLSIIQLILIIIIAVYQIFNIKNFLLKKQII